jgi:hypothetical protein
MNYYKVYFSHQVNGRVIAENLNELESRINSYLLRQNKGEAKSDRLHLVSYEQVTLDEYTKPDICVGSLDEVPSDYDSDFDKTS